MEVGDCIKNGKNWNCCTVCLSTSCFTSPRVSLHPGFPYSIKIVNVTCDGCPSVVYMVRWPLGSDVTGRELSWNRRQLDTGSTWRVFPGSTCLFLLLFFFFYRKRMVEPRGGFFPGNPWQPKMAGKYFVNLFLYFFSLNTWQEHMVTKKWRENTLQTCSSMIPPQHMAKRHRGKHRANPHGKSTQQHHMAMSRMDEPRSKTRVALNQGA